jgi:hypothetical protein
LHRTSHRQFSKVVSPETIPSQDLPHTVRVEQPFRVLPSQNIYVDHQACQCQAGTSTCLSCMAAWLPDMR